MHIKTFSYIAIYLLLFSLSGCAGLGLEPVVEKNAVSPAIFQVEEQEQSQQFASPAFIRELSKEQESAQGYKLGPGDVMDISVWRREEISRKNIVVAPDGVISVPKVGILNVRGKTITEITDQLTTILSRNYENPEVTMTIREFHNNKAFVLGRVSEPGVVNFPGDGTLLEALALAGGLPHIGKDTFLTKCAIIRGNDTVIWIDLRDLLDHGNMTLNARIMNNDVIFIPEAEDELVMVMGEVGKAGPVLLKRGLNLVDAVMRAGGYTNDADLENVFIVRQTGGQGEIRQVNLKSMLETGDFSQNYALMQDDIVYVGPTGMRKFNYALEQLLPSLKVLSMSTEILNNLGLTEKVFNVSTE
jgi:polysaccharide export outer membrane protein